VLPARAALVFLFCCCCAVSAAAQPPLAIQITAENAAELLIGGPDAIGGVGDWYLANELVEVIVDDPSRQHAKLDHGGTIVDAGLRDRRGEDQFARLIPLLNLSQRLVLGYDRIRAERSADGQSARLVVSSPQVRSIPRGGSLARTLDPLVPQPDALRGVSVETRYELRAGEPFVRITTRIENRGNEPAPIFSYGDLWMRGGRSMRAFVANVTHPERSTGFEHASFSRNLLGSLNALEAFSHVAMAGLPAYPPIAYGLFSPERNAAGLPFYGVTGEHVTLAASLLGDAGGAGWPALRLLAATRRELAGGASWEIERRLLIVPGADVGSVTDAVLPLLGVAVGASGLAGRSLPEDVRALVYVETGSGQPVTQLLAREGRYRASLPPGDYRLTLRAEHREPITRSVRVGSQGFALLEDVHWPALAVLRFDGAFADGGALRLVVRGRDGTPDPVFEPELLGFRIDGTPSPSASETGSLYFVGNAHDPTRVPLPAGRYRLTATRGPEFDTQTREIEIADGELFVAPFELTRIASLGGYVSADLHVHAQASDDTGTPNAQRLRDFVAAGVDVMVASDHDHIADYDAALAEQGLAGRIRVVRGVEVTSSTPSDAAPWTIGHHNAWPMRFDPRSHRQGAPPSQDLTVAALYSLLRREYGAGVVQLNHPRGKQPGIHDGNYFTHLGSRGEALDTSLPLGAEPNAELLAPASDGTRALDFDVIEVMNGHSWEQYLATRADFHWLLRQGIRRTATANSDTHGPNEPAGFPRNYVRVPAGLENDDAALDEALRRGRSFGTTGPLITHFSVDGASMGDTLRTRGGRVKVEWEVVTAPWVPRGEVRLLVNGEVVRIFDETSGELTLTIARDAFVTLEAGVSLDVDPAIWFSTRGGTYRDDVAPGFLPAAFANPIFVDADGDGLWRAPGLLPAAPRTLAPAAALSLALVALALIQVTRWSRRRWRGEP
jgi:hypothetical protein